MLAIPKPTRARTPTAAAMTTTGFLKDAVSATSGEVPLGEV
jgi:hypothetical protein